MNIDEFYDADPRRRESGELELGTDWNDGAGGRFELSWVVDTGELYLMADPKAYVAEGVFGGYRPGTISADSEHVAIIASIGTEDEIHSVLKGWESVIEEDNSLSWLAERIAAAGVGVAPS